MAFEFGKASMHPVARNMEHATTVARIEAVSGFRTPRVMRSCTCFLHRVSTFKYPYGLHLS
jgi:hypothetical protein